jgi:membrane protease YdiL (CAAX protease family)
VSTSLLDRIVYVRPDRLRSGWRITLFVLAGLAASNVGVPLVAMGLPAASMLWLRPTLECLAVVFATRYATTRLDGTGWNAVGLGQAAWRPRLILLGLGAGALAIALPTALLLVLGDLSFTPAPTGDVSRALLFSFTMLGPAALTEELLMRGYPFAVLSGEWGWPVATAVTSVVFGALHLGNPGVTPLAIANVVAAGVFLAGVRVVTGSLAAAWAAHFAWNWTMSAGFHASVSGLPFGTPGYRLTDTGPDWLSGGAWGPEGGVGAAVGMMGAFAGLSWATRRMRAGPSPAASGAVSIQSGGTNGHQEHEA